MKLHHVILFFHIFESDFVGDNWLSVLWAGCPSLTQPTQHQTRRSLTAHIFYWSTYRVLRFLMSLCMHYDTFKGVICAPFYSTPIMKVLMRVPICCAKKFSFTSITEHHESLWQVTYSQFITLQVLRTLQVIRPETAKRCGLYHVSLSSRCN